MSTYKSGWKKGNRSSKLDKFSKYCWVMNNVSVVATTVTYPKVWFIKESVYLERLCVSLVFVYITIDILLYIDINTCGFLYNFSKKSTTIKYILFLNSTGLLCVPYLYLDEMKNFPPLRESNTRKTPRNLLFPKGTTKKLGN